MCLPQLSLLGRCIQCSLILTAYEMQIKIHIFSPRSEIQNTLKKTLAFLFTSLVCICNFWVIQKGSSGFGHSYMTLDAIFNDVDVFNFAAFPALVLLQVVSGRGFKHLESEICTVKKELDLP